MLSGIRRMYLFSVTKSRPPTQSFVRDLLKINTVAPTRAQIPPFIFNTYSASVSEFEHLPKSAQERVLELLTKFKEGPHFKARQQKTIENLEEWVKEGDSHPESKTYNFLLHLCVNHGSAEDIEMVAAIAKRYGVSLGEGELNMILTGLSLSATLAKVKNSLHEITTTGGKLRVNTQTSLLQRAVNERDLPFALEVIELMKESEHFPSSSCVISDAIGACVGVEGSEAVRMVQGVMGLHNVHTLHTHRHEVEEDTARAFTKWMQSLPGQCDINRTTVTNRSVCRCCGEQLVTNELSQEEHSQLVHHFREELKYEVGTGRGAQLERRMAQDFVMNVKRDDGCQYGAILDGLNIAFSLRRATRKSDRQFDHVLEIASRLVQHTGKEVLVIGRPHITKLLPRYHRESRHESITDAVNREYRSHGVHMILLNDSSRDDRYLLYAALANNSLLVSNDEFGDKMHWQSWDMKSVFLKWQRSRQVRFTVRGNTRKLEYPSHSERVVQWTNGSWHIPLLTSSRNNWLCARLF